MLLPLYPAKSSEEIDEMINNEDIKDFFKENEGQTYCLNNFLRVRGKWEYHFRRADLLEKMMITGKKKSYGYLNISMIYYYCFFFFCRNANLKLTKVKENQEEQQPSSPSFTLLSLRRLSRSLQKDPAPPLSSLQEKIKKLEQSKTLLTPPPSAPCSSFPSLHLPPSSLLLPLSSSLPPSSLPPPSDPLHASFLVPSSLLPPTSLLSPTSLLPPSPSPFLSSSVKELFLGFLGKTSFFEKETRIEMKKEVLGLVKGFVHYGEEYLEKEEERKVKTKINFDKNKGSSIEGNLFLIQ